MPRLLPVSWISWGRTGWGEQLSLHAEVHGLEQHPRRYCDPAGLCRVSKCWVGGEGGMVMVWGAGQELRLGTCDGQD
jgi:hypothetical protein